METSVFIIVFFILLSTLSYHKASLTLFTCLSFVLLLLGSWLGIIGQITWILFFIICILLHVHAIRERVFSQAGLAFFRRMIPAMSHTEKEAIDAGTLWFEADLFRGAPNWNKLHDIPIPRLNMQEQAFLEGPVNTLCKMICDHQITHVDADLPPPVWAFLKENHFFAMIIKKEYGGLEFSAYAQSLVLQKLSGVSNVLSSTVGVPNSLGPAELLQRYGTEEQKNHYLPRLASGREIPCFALTSPEAGSDAASIPDIGIVKKGLWKGKKVIGMSITWNKRYITLAPVATLLGLTFKLEDPDALLGPKKDIGITCALIPTQLKGIEIGRRHFPLNIPFQNGPTQGENIFVPLDFIIGGPKMAGKGWGMIVECLSVGRGITLPSNATGSIKTIALATGAYARIRRQFKIPIGEMEGIEAPLARLAANAYLVDSACTLTVAGIDLGEKPSVISAIVKYHCTDRGQKAAIDAMDILGGKGICLGPKNFMARTYQGAPIAVTVEGANILTRSLIIFGQGAIRCHPYILSEIQAANHKNETEALGRFDRLFFAHIGYVISHFVRSIWLGLTDGKTSNAPKKDKVKAYYQQMNRYSANLALLTEVSMALFGGRLKRKERLSARLGDVLSQLYLASSTLKRFADEGHQKEDLPLVDWAIQDALYQAEQAIIDFLNNCPHQGITFALRIVLFPFGPRRTKPNDRLDSRVAKILQTPSQTRKRLGRHLFLEPSEFNSVGKIEKALFDLLNAEPIYLKICQATGQDLPFMFLDKMAQMALDKELINEEEGKILCLAEAGRIESIGVDDFDSKELAAK